MNIPKIKCRQCNQEFQQWSGNKFLSHFRRVFCSRKCQYLSYKKPVDGYRKCLFCDRTFPFRNSLKVRSYGGIGSVKQKFCSRYCNIIFQTRRKPKPTPEVKNKISVALRGRKNTWGHKISKSISGSKHWNWKGGISPKNNSERSCIELKNWRRGVFIRDKFTCVNCGYKGKRLEADHVKSWSKYPELRFVLDNGRTLCKECHSKTPNWRGRGLGLPPKAG